MADDFCVIQQDKLGMKQYTVVALLHLVIYKDLEKKNPKQSNNKFQQVCPHQVYKWSDGTYTRRS